MLRCRLLLFLSILLLSGAKSQDTTETTSSTTPWTGDPNLCPPGALTTPVPGKAMPNFPFQAEFALEQIERDRLLNITLPKVLSTAQHIFDYGANKVIIVKNKNGLITAEYYDYKFLRKSTYYAGTYCTVEKIDTNNEMNGGSAVQLRDGTWHVRPLNEYLLFSNMDPDRQIIEPVYMGQGSRRGITVDLWRTCYFSRSDYRTVRRIWAFATSNVTTPFGVVGTSAVPIHAEISASYSNSSGTELFEIDEFYNIQSYKPGIVENNDALSTPKGVFCKVENDTNLISLTDIGISWPNYFSVRVDASSSRSPRTQRFHLRYGQGRDGTARRLRYDYIPPGSEDFRSVIHDYSDLLTYTIDRRLGSCDITRLVDYPSVSPIRDPIEFFIKYESSFIFNPPQKAWAFNGVRTCRGNNIKCSIVTTSVDNFPPMVDSDTGLPTGESWAATNIEYSWSIRNPNLPPPPGATILFDYPVSLYMRMFRFTDPLNPSIVNILTEDVEYEFFEMAHDSRPNDFDISTCYRSNGYEYLHVFFSLKADRSGIFDTSLLNRREFERQIVRNIANKTQTKYSRISDVEVEHERVSQSVNVFFTILGQTRIPETSSFDTREPDVTTARNNLQQVIDAGNFQFNTALFDGSNVVFRAESNSLKSSQQYMSTHSTEQVTSSTTYSSGAQALAIILGLLIGLVVGVIGAVIIRKIRNEPIPSIKSVTSPLPSINFSSKKASTEASSA